jgi:predicted nuclease with TOPRIM domain
VSCFFSTLRESLVWQRLDEAQKELKARKDEGVKKEQQLLAQIQALNQESVAHQEEASSLRSSLVEAGEEAAAAKVEMARLEAKLKQHSKVRFPHDVHHDLLNVLF